MSHLYFTRRMLLAIVAGLLVAGIGCQRTTAPTDDGKKAIRWGADEEGGLPYVAKEDGKYVGFEVDLAEALSKELGRPIEFKQYPFKDLAKGLKRGDIDIAMNGFEVTEDRKTQVRFGKPYYYYKLQLVAQSGDERFKNTKDLEGKKDLKVGTLENTAASRYLEKIGLKPILFEDQVNPYKKLAAKELDAVLLDLPIAVEVVKKNKELNEKLVFVGEPIEPGQYAIAFRKDDAKLAEQFDQALEQLIRKGELKRIYEKWGLWNDDQKQLEASLPKGTPSPLPTNLGK
ncbi:MAG: ABC transporter substrate-binding protein [Gemmataceae bacterium]|nr:ABC transporter substrate-binding protein [Gemmataceae bacterium]